MFLTWRGGNGHAATLARYTIVILLVLHGAFSIVLLAHQATRIAQLDDVGYADSYIFYHVQQYQETGRIYRDLSLPPYLPAVYSPAIYILYSLPAHLLATDNLFVGPRLLALAAFLACLALVGSITRALVPGRYAWVWGVLLACTVGNLWEWVLMLRADFPGIALNLLAIRLLLAPSRRLVPLAGLCAGLALQFKFTFVAAGFAGMLWLLARQEWKLAAQYVVVAAVVSIGGYALYSLHDPRMLPQVLGLSPGVPDLRGAVKLTYAAATNLLVPLALLGLPMLAWRPPQRWGLLVMYAATAALVGAVTIVQAGASDNYYFEALFAITPVAVLGVYQLVAIAGRNPASALFVAPMLAMLVVVPRTFVVRDRVLFGEPVRDQNARFAEFRDALAGAHIFSTLPRLALLDSQPALLEPGLLNYSQRLGKIDPTPLLRRVSSGEFDVVVVSAEPAEWRTVLFVSQELHDAILSAYAPGCTYDAGLVFLPRHASSRSASISARLNAIGCIPYGTKRPLDW